LSDSPLITAETKAQIKRIAREMGYTPDARARSLVMGETRTVGVVVTTIADPFMAPVVQGIESAAYENGYSVILASANSDPAREIAAVEMLQSKRVDGVIVTASRVGALYQDHLERIGVPVVLLNNHSEQSGRYLYTVTVDNQHGAHLATQHLIGLGHRRIAYIAGHANHSSNTARMEGYRQALSEAGISFAPDLIAPGDGKMDAGMRALPALMNLSERPTALFCYNDMTAIGVLRAARQLGLVIPHDLSIVGFDDIVFASFVTPPLTTIAQPQFDMGQQAMRMLLTRIRQSSDAPVSDVVIKGKLLVRESTRARA
jgi:DNA-binding LacI/PurR family transcriptional regulator